MTIDTMEILFETVIYEGTTEIRKAINKNPQPVMYGNYPDLSGLFIPDMKEVDKAFDSLKIAEESKPYKQLYKGVEKYLKKETKRILNSVIMSAMQEFYIPKRSTRDNINDKFRYLETMIGLTVFKKQQKIIKNSLINWSGKKPYTKKELDHIADLLVLVWRYEDQGCRLNKHWPSYNLVYNRADTSTIKKSNDTIWLIDWYVPIISEAQTQQKKEEKISEFMHRIKWRKKGDYYLPVRTL